MRYLPGRRTTSWMPKAAASSTTALIAVGLVAVTGTGTAYAYFNGGHGTGAGSATSEVAKTVTATLVGSAGTLYPGGTADVTVSITNPYSNRVLTLTGVTAGTGSIVVSHPSGSCASGAAADVSVNTSGASLSPTTISGGATTQVTITGAVKMGTNSATGCQGAAFAVPVAVTMKVG